MFTLGIMQRTGASDFLAAPADQTDKQTEPDSTQAACLYATGPKKLNVSELFFFSKRMKGKGHTLYMAPHSE